MKKILLVAGVLLAIVSAAVLIWLPLGGPPTPKLVVLGIDGLDHRVAERMIAKGELPTIEKLYQAGAAGTVRNSDLGVPAVSPAIWTTYVTGVLPEQHGIRGFVFDGAGGTELFRSVHRKAPALQEMLSQAGTSVGVVNWWFSYPPEQVRGFVVSDRYFEGEAERAVAFFAPQQVKEAEAPPVYPLGLLKHLKLSRTEKFPDVLSAAEAAKLDGAMLELAYAATKANPVDVLLVYLNGLDRVSHMTWDANDPEGLGGAEVRAHMRNIDRFIAQMVSWAGPKAHIVLLSDHGFEPSPHGTPPGVHESKEAADAGILVVAGPAIKPGKKLGAISPLDVLPTLLALAEVPLPEGISGAVLREAFRPGARDFAALEQRRRYTRLPVVEGKLRTAGGAADAVDQATKERLRALGYIE